MNEADTFPDLPPEIQAYIRDLEARNAQLSARVRQLEEQFRLAQLKRYAPSSEKRSERVFNEAEQMGPEPQQEAVALPDTGLPDAAPAVPGKRGRKPLPADLPRKRVVHDIPEDQRTCANRRRQLGWRKPLSCAVARYRLPAVGPKDLRS